ncbi:PP2C family protein-serine/threonine phosphatase [Streptomyces sp. NPDC101132]|uniref:PP2C family protein-serine/threonine phosphatase n=1 Tax=Streptomyces sp. NPDC101132 TaxID=3366110 RepID=UPI0037F19916
MSSSMSGAYPGPPVWQDLPRMDDMENCTACGGTVAPDGHCWDCGTRRPAHRARLEAGAPDGAAGVCDRGRVKGVNADAMALVTAGEWTVGTVCDGVSMAPRAERAATLAAEVGARVLAALLTEGRLPEEALETSGRRAGRAVAALAGQTAGSVRTADSARKPDSTGAVGSAPAPGSAPACTYLAAAVGPQGLWCGWLGDSRAYWLPDRGTAFRLTEDDRGTDGMAGRGRGGHAGPRTLVPPAGTGHPAALHGRPHPLPPRPGGPGRPPARRRHPPDPRPRPGGPRPRLRRRGQHHGPPPPGTGSEGTDLGGLTGGGTPGAPGPAGVDGASAPATRSGTAGSRRGGRRADTRRPTPDARHRTPLRACG